MRGPIITFLEGTVVYALSKQWDDLMSTYFFKLHLVPYCGVEHLACSAYVENSGMAGHSARNRRLICRGWHRLEAALHELHLGRVLRRIGRRPGFCRHS